MLKQSQCSSSSPDLFTILILPGGRPMLSSEAVFHEIPLGIATPEASHHAK